MCSQSLEGFYWVLGRPHWDFEGLPSGGRTLLLYLRVMEIFCTFQPLLCRCYFIILGG